MNKTAIEWTDLTWNPVTGCKHGCSYCYARRIYQRFGRSFEPEFHPERMEQPLKKRKPSKIFVCSVADLFGDWVPQRWINQVLDVVRKCPQHTFQFLTKDPRRLPDQYWPENAWVGVTATNQKAWDRATRYLPKVNALTFISVEPVLDPIEVGNWMPDWLIIGAQTGPGGFQPKREWVGKLTQAARAFDKQNLVWKNACAVFYKPNLIWENAPREFPND